MKKISAYQDIVNRIHFYMENPHLNPLDVDYIKCKDYDREPYQDLVDKTECAFCGEVLTEYKFCSDECARAYWND